MSDRPKVVRASVDTSMRENEEKHANKDRLRSRVDMDGGRQQTE